MIKKIKFLEQFKTIPKDFVLELERMTVITGENNSGKTNFIKAVYDETSVEFLDETDAEIMPQIVYIAAENIKPSDSECKTSAVSTGLIENLAILFSNLKVKFELEKREAIIGDIKNLIKKTNENLEKFSGCNKHELSIAPNEKELDPKILIKALIKNIKGIESGQERELEDLGQGTQRIIVASILKAYLDILIEKKINLEKPILILFEEPEIYLHPRLKRTLNVTLESISQQDNHQVVITTHDPYFAFKNLTGKDKTIVSFKKDNEITEILPRKIIEGIEDELLFIFLFNLLESKKDGSLIVEDLPNFQKRKYYTENGDQKDYCDLRYIRHQIHHLGGNPHTIGLVTAKTKECLSKNYYTENELTSAIKAMSERIGR